MKLWIVGFGSGSLDNMTEQAKAALAESDVVVGYPVYLTLLRPLLGDKRCVETPMKQEIERCRLAIEEALKGQTVSLVCSGDSGVYGLAGLALELAKEYPPLEIEIVSGVTAACSGAAVLGAPLNHDFAVVSLSDLLTPWETIEKRLAAAAQADFVLCLYNPASRRRKDHLRRACEVLLRYRGPETLCGYVRQIGREGETSGILTLEELKELEADMFTTVFVGSSQTKKIGERMVTPRGYRL